MPQERPNALTIRPLAHCLYAFRFPVLHFVHEFSRATLGLKVCVCTPCLLSGALLSPNVLLLLLAGTVGVYAFV